MRVELRQPVVVILITLLPLGVVGAAGTARPSDKTIWHWVKSALQDDPRLATVNVGLDVADGIVTLTGTVENLAEKQYALREAQKIYGVRGVIEKLYIEAGYRSDADIKEDVRARLVASSSIPIRLLGVAVEKGEVTLMGEVHSAARREEAWLLAAEVRGVRAVHNRLAVSPAQARPDSEIQQDIVNSLQRDVYLTGLPITVSVADGVATLSGDVGNAYERLRAEERARVVNNVRDVRNTLTVQSWEQRGVRQKASDPGPLSLEKAVRDELELDGRIPIANIWVDAGHQAVTLRGIVPMLQQKRIAEQDAMNVVGVRSVINQLEVETEWRDDNALGRDVQTAVDSDDLLNGQDIRVRVRDGVLTLSGTVTSAFQKYHAEDVALRIRGLRGLANAITVDAYPQFTDVALRLKIKDRLAAHWETHHIADAIDVAVTDGKVTLTGEVNTLAQRAEVERVAGLTEGVQSVDNQLAVVR